MKLIGNYMQKGGLKTLFLLKGKCLEATFLY